MTGCCFRVSLAVSCFLLVAWSLSPANSSSSVPDSFPNVTYVDNTDGDTITFNIPGAPAIIGREVSVRLRGIDTPELRKSACQAERIKALEAKERVRSLLSNARMINLHNSGRGKYFRILADVEFDGRDLSTLLLKEQLGVPYSGGSRNHDWCSKKKSSVVPAQNHRGVLPPLVNGVYVWPPPPGSR